MGKKLETVKGVVKIAVGLGVSTIVNNVIKNNTSEEKGAVKKLCIWAGGLALVGIACSKANQYVDGAFNAATEVPKEEDKPEEKSEEEKEV